MVGPNRNVGCFADILVMAAEPRWLLLCLLAPLRDAAAPNPNLIAHSSINQICCHAHGHESHAWTRVTCTDTSHVHCLSGLSGATSQRVGTRSPQALHRHRSSSTSSRRKMGVGSNKASSNVSVESQGHDVHWLAQVASQEV